MIALSKPASLLRPILFVVALAVAGGPISTAHGAGTLDEPTFRALLLELGPKVNFFRDYWAKDARAVFVGGPVRDFSLWIRGRLARAEAQGELEEEIAKLRALSNIDIREFMAPESDLDILTNRPIQLDGVQYGVGKAERIDPQRFDFSTAAGRDEVLQGFLPIEKIRLGKDRVETRFGRPGQEVDALPEIVARKYTGVFPVEGEFRQTARAIAKENHPLLLALRYLRLASSDAYQLFGRADPGKAYETVLDPRSRSEVERIVRSSFRDGAFREAMREPGFVYRVNKAISRFMSAGVNTTASWRLGDALGLGELVGQFDSLLKLNQFLFIPDFAGKPKAYQGLEPFTSVAAEIPELVVYHGTPEEIGYVKILRQNALPSTSGLAGRGLYVAKRESLDIPLVFAGGAKDRIVTFKLDPGARFVDITQGVGQRAFERFVATNGLGGQAPSDQCERFIQELGVDVLKYPYFGHHAYVVNNSGVLSHPEGLHRKIRTFSQLQRDAAGVRGFREYLDFVRAYQVNPFTESESVEIIRSVGGKRSLKGMIDAFERRAAQTGDLAPGLRKVAYETFLAYGALRELSFQADRHASDQALQKIVFEINGSAFAAAAPIVVQSPERLNLIQEAIAAGFAGSRSELQVETILAGQFSKALRKMSPNGVPTSAARVVRDGFRQFIRGHARGLLFAWGILAYLNYKAFTSDNELVMYSIGAIDAIGTASYFYFSYLMYMQSELREAAVVREQQAIRASVVDGIQASLRRYDGGCVDLLAPAEAPAK